MAKTDISAKISKSNNSLSLYVVFTQGSKMESNPKNTLQCINKTAAKVFKTFRRYPESILACWLICQTTFSFKNVFVAPSGNVFRWTRPTAL